MGPFSFQKDTHADREAVAHYLAPVAQRLQDKIKRDGPLREDYKDVMTVLSLVMNSRSLQLFMADFLRGNLPMMARQYRNKMESKGYAIDKMVADIRSKNRFLDTEVFSAVRSDDVFPMTSRQFEQAAKAIRSEKIQAVAAILQTGIRDYFTEIQTLLETSFGLVSIANAQKRLSVGIRSDSIWRELMFFMGTSHHDGQDFANTYNHAKNHGFQSQGFSIGTVEITKCPAQQIIHHMCSMNFKKADDGSLIRQSPHHGALLGFVAREWEEQSAKQLSPLSPIRPHADALTAG